jgi:type II secretion system protein L
MTTLRVRLAAPPSSSRADPWALYDGTGKCVRTGIDPPSEWPAADDLEFVLAASQLRIAIVTLPPVPTARVAGAATFALEDQLAGPAASHHLAFSSQAPDGRVRVAIVARSLIAALAAAHTEPARIIAEPDLAPSLSMWRWCATEERDGGFVRRPDGSAFPVDPPSAEGAIPVELGLALAEARRAGETTPEVRVDAPYSEQHFGEWSRETGASFALGAPWRWQDAPASVFVNAIDLAPSDVPTSKASRPSVKRFFAPALGLVGVAVVLQLVGTLGEWAWLRIEAWREGREWTSLALTAGVPGEAAATPDSARAALGQRYAELRHARGLAAPTDALPLLARAAPVLAALPPGSVKSAVFSDGHWTLELARADASIVSNLDASMRAAGLPALVVVTPAGARVRFGAS